VTLPLGMQLVHGTRVIIDNNKPQQAPYVICFANGCMSDYDVTPDLIARLKRGQNLTVQAINSNGAPLTLPLPLADFAKAYDGAPTDPKVYEATQKKLQDELAQRAASKGQPSNEIASIDGTASRNSATAAAGSTQQMQAVAPIPNLVAPVGRRVALIIGNSGYKFMPSLQNPRNDAADVETALKGLGFETVMAKDLDRAGMNASLEKFSLLVQGANVGLVFYSGHGMQFNGKNYLLPTDADLKTAADVTGYRLLPLDDLIQVLSGANGLQLIILDACRNNPVERGFKNSIASVPGGNRDAALTRGFARIAGRSGLIITYATEPNEVASDGDGRNSPFTKAFLSNIMTPDLDVRTVLFNVQREVYGSSGKQQLPEISSFYVGPEVRLKTSQR